MAVRQIILRVTAGWFCCALLWSGSVLSAQQGSVSFEKAINHYLKGDYYRAESLFKTSEHTLQSARAYDSLTELLSYRASIERRLNRPDTADQLLDRATQIASQFLSDDHIVWSQIYNNRVYLALEEQDHETARQWAAKSQKIADSQITEFGMNANTWLATGYIEDIEGNYDEAEIYYSRALETAQKGLDSKDPISISATIASNNNLGIVYRLTGRPGMAIKFYENNQPLIASFYSPTHSEAGKNFNNIGAVYFEIGDYGESIGYFSRAASLFEAAYNEDDPTLAAAYNNIGAAYANLGEMAEAAYHFEKSLAIKLRRFGDKHLDTAIAYSNLANLYQNLGNSDKAIDYFSKSLSIRRSVYGNRHVQLIIPLLMRASLYLELEQVDHAAVDLESAKTISENRLGQTHPHFIESTLLLGQLLELQGQPINAMEQYQLAIINSQPHLLNSGHSNTIEAIQTTTHPFHLLDALQRKAALLDKLHSPNGKTDSLATSLDTWVMAIKVLEITQMNYSSDNSKLIVAENNVHLFDRAMATAYQLYTLTGADRYLETALWIMEKSRSRITHEYLSESDARKLAGVPESITEPEKELRLEITRIERQLKSLMSTNDESFDRVLVRALQDSLFNLKLQQKEYIDYLENRYPDFYTLKFDRTTPSSNDLQHLLTQSESSMLIYYVGSETNYIMTFSGGNTELKRLRLREPLDSRIRQLHNALQTSSTDEFAVLANGLYEDLLEPVINDLPDNMWIIIPDRTLHFLPFELLLDQLPDGQPLSQWSWVINKREISYAPSTTIFQRMHRQTSDSDKTSLLAVAPFASAESRIVTSDSPSSQRVLPSLPFSRLEAEQVTQIMRLALPQGQRDESMPITLLLGNKASQESLKDLNLENYHYIHFSTHTVIDDDSPETSGIHLAAGGNTSEKLFLSDIIGLGLQADMVVLSGCESGLGKFASGEGVLGFTNAFIQGGARNLVTSLWKVDDRMTTELMTRFYRELVNGSRKSKALRDAKLSMIQDPRMSHPSTWASFTLTGAGH